MKLAACVLLLAAAATATDLFKEGRKRYDGYKVFQITPQSRLQMALVHRLGQDVELDIWEETRIVGRPVSIMVPPHKLNSIAHYLKKHSLTYNIIRDNVQEQMDKELARLQKRVKGDKFEYDINDYNTFEDIMTELDAMVTRCPTNFTCEVYSAGNSLEGRELKVLKISKAGSGRQGFWMDSAIHAREWLAPATNLRILDRLIRDYDTDTVVQELLDDYDWYFMPIMNPDGYIYSWEWDRMWRKNRNVNDDICYGVDLNRNFDAVWGHDGTSADPCSNTYHGATPGSEPETDVVQAEARRLGSSLRAWVSIHTAAQMWLMPWGHTDSDTWECVRADDHDQLQQVADAAADATEDRHDTFWTRGNSCETIYAASGLTMDYAKATGGVKYGYTPELRGPGFDPGPEEIQPSYEEMWDGVVAMVREIKVIEG